MTPARFGPGPEFEQIRRVLERLGPIAAGVGDDCAVLPPGEGEVVASTDLSLEGVHFRTEWLEWEEVGWRAAAAAMSDLAACGASAVGILVSIGIASARADAVETIMAGAGAAAASVGATVLGGDLSRSERVVVGVAVLGRASRPVPRTGAAPGDGVWLTGALGGARVALEAWNAGLTPGRAARERFARPRPRIAEGRWLGAHGVHAMIDVSDGVGSDARHLAAASGAALRIDLERVPLDAGVASAAALRGERAHAFAATGGEDYELLAALPPSFGEGEAAEFREVFGLPLTRVGEVLAGAGVTFHANGGDVELAGFDHFR